MANAFAPDGSFGAGDGERETLDQSIDWDALPDRGAQANCGTGTAGATQSASATMMADTTLSDGVTLPEGGGRSEDPSLISSALRPRPFWSDGIALLEGSELDACAGEAGGNSRGVSDADAVANGGDGMSPRGRK